MAGAGHRARGIGCEDASCVEVTDDGTLLVAVADGAGSARLADEGSTRAVAAAMEGCAPVATGRKRPWKRRRLALEPVAAGERFGDLATTLLVVRVGGGVVETAQVGDGAVVLRRGGCARGRSPPTPRASTSTRPCFLTSEGWRESLRCECVSADGVDGVAAMTDGLQLVAFDLATGEAHAPFFAPFFAYVAGDGDVDSLEAFLGSDRVAERTDDDVTLAVAALVPS